MANRHLSRSVAMQSLFEWDFNDQDSSVMEEVIKRNVDEFAPGLDETSFIHDLVFGVIKQKNKLDNIIEKAAPDWPINQIAGVDRNILRLGLYELLFGDKAEVPARVAINEAIELAKTFGGENSGRFVNGVLGAVYKEMGEPGKNDIPTKKTRIKNVPYEQMPIDKLGGAVVYTNVGGQINLALVHDVFGYWTLSKGHIKEGETNEEGTSREVKEEISLAIDIKEEIGFNEYIASDPERGKLRKQVTYFLAEAGNPAELKLGKEKGGLDETKWFPLAEVPELKIYDDILPIITKAIKIILNKQ
ncbi:MAG: transcription antitermination factor NusB [Patescibacteria group bacterium]